jgi:hypothetical protein
MKMILAEAVRHNVAPSGLIIINYSFPALTRLLRNSCPDYRAAR